MLVKWFEGKELVVRFEGFGFDSHVELLNED